jgi:organic hydroperoxide reductase OsmC/OhrA
MAQEYRATVRWQRGEGEVFTDQRYARAHVWAFDGGVDVPASSAPSSVPPPYSRADAVDPEEALVAAASSCHMLFFLHFAAKRGFVIERYEDKAVGVMTKNERGKLFISTITLDPAIAFAGERRPTSEEIAELHHRSHEECFIANSVRATIVITGLDPAQ